MYWNIHYSNKEGKVCMPAVPVRKMLFQSQFAGTGGVTQHWVTLVYNTWSQLPVKCKRSSKLKNKGKVATTLKATGSDSTMQLFATTSTVPVSRRTRLRFCTPYGWWNRAENTPCRYRAGPALALSRAFQSAEQQETQLQHWRLQTN